MQVFDHWDWSVRNINIYWYTVVPGEEDEDEPDQLVKNDFWLSPDLRSNLRLILLYLKAQFKIKNIEIKRINQYEFIKLVLGFLLIWFQYKNFVNI